MNRKSAAVPLMMALLLFALAAGAADPAKSPAKSVAVAPQDVAWGTGPAFLPAGAKIAVLAGDPGGRGEFTLRLSLPDGYEIPAHWHPAAENVTVISGEFHVGMGNKLDHAQGMALPAGGFGSLPAKMNHYAWAQGETVIQVHGMGPFAITYVNPADDPRHPAAK